MVISEMIAGLEKQQRILGDVPVVIHNQGECSMEWWEEVTEFQLVTDISINEFDKNLKLEILPVAIEIY